MSRSAPVVSPVFHPQNSRVQYRTLGMSRYSEYMSPGIAPDNRQDSMQVLGGPVVRHHLHL